MTTNFMSPGGSSEVAITDTNPSNITVPGALVQLEAEQPRRVLRGDLAQILLGSLGGRPIEDAGKDHRRQRVAHPVVRGGAAGPGELAEVHGELAPWDTAAGRADVQEQWKPEVLRGPPEPVVDRVPIRPLGQRRNGNERPDQPELRAALELLTGVVDVVDVEHGDALEAIGIGLAE